ncbi:Uncharacterised protein [Chlamydia trachomatis]|nr:Uncharacterised protein [Chlamydia trachomatis]CRH48744.1 Uncharacterised protein [Chlamydia trachomatis]CRH72770.1 Uncharacterised protein [Chlamydia trachomatis]CRH87721.1 Uncharacterised protein [Chlamydia trachomatis]CRI74512.1 Uncharacterised protein [Chlamydia trachomatis]
MTSAGISLEANREMTGISSKIGSYPGVSAMDAPKYPCSSVHKALSLQTPLCLLKTQSECSPCRLMAAL